MNSDTASIKAAIRLHGKAWLAVDKWCQLVLGDEFIEGLDSLYAKANFYPVIVLAAAKKEMNRAYHHGMRTRKKAGQ